MGITFAVKHNYRARKNKSGAYPVHIRVRIDGHPEYYAVDLPQNIPTADWSNKNGCWVKNTNIYSFQINEAISSKLKMFTSLHKRFLDQDRKLTFAHIDKELGFKGNRLCFNDYFKQYIKNPPPTVALQPASWEKYQSFIQHLDNFNPKLRFDEIDWEMVANIRNYLAEQPGQKSPKMQPASVKSLFDKFRKVLEHAAKKDNLIDIKLVESCFEEVKVTVPEREVGLHLEVHEIKDLRRLVFDGRYPSQERDRDIFMFMIYAGFYYMDMVNFEREYLRKDYEFGYYILGGRDKNGKPAIIPLWKFPHAIEILRQYEDPDPDSKYFFRRDIFVDPQVFNRNIKEICKIAGIKRPVSAKTARHTNAQLWIRFGAERPVLSKMLGHEIESTTGTYYRVHLLEVIEGTKNADFEKLGI